MKSLLITAFIFFWAAIGFAQQEEPAIPQEEEVTVEDYFNLVQEGKVITSTRTERLLKTAPHALTVITRKQIEDSGATNLAEVLRFVPGVNARLTPMGSQIGIRSFGSTPFSERVLFLINGTPYNSPDKGGYSGHPAFEDFFPLEAVKRIEVLKGPGSALFGQNAFFGIINIITDDFPGVHQVMGTGGSRDTGSFVARGGDKINDWSYTYLGKFKQQNGPMKFLQITDPNAQPGPTDTEVGNTDVKSGDAYFKVANRNLAFSYLFHRDETGSFNWIAPPQLNKEECCITFPTEQTLQFIDGTYTKKFENENNWRLKAFYNRRNGNVCGNCHFNAAGAGLLEQEEINQRFFVNTQYDWILPSHKVIFGADVQFDKTDKAVGQLANIDKDIQTFGAYVQDEITFADNRAIATLGLRVDHNEITETSVSPSASLVFHPNDKFVVRTLYGRAFRQPTWNDLFNRIIYSPVTPHPTQLDLGFIDPALRQPFEQNGNPDLTTERIDTFEAGAEYFFNPNTSVKFDLFFSHVGDLIEGYDFRRCVPGDPNTPPECIPFLAQFDNPSVGFLAKTKNLEDLDLDTRGFEVELRLRPSPMFSAIFGYAFQDNDFERLGVPGVGAGPGGVFLSAYSPENKITAMVEVRPVDMLLFNLSLNYWSDYDTRFFAAGAACGACTNTDEIGQPYTYANFKTLVMVPVGQQELGLGFTVKNLFDEEVQLSHGFRVDAALFGREYFAQIFYKF